MLLLPSKLGQVQIFLGISRGRAGISHSNHKQEVKKKIGGLGQHYGGDRACSYQDISIVLIEQVEQGNRTLLAKRERFWQNQLRAFVENGGNAQCIRKDFDK